MVANEDLHDQGRWGQTIQERRQYIANTARCADCQHERGVNEAINQRTGSGTPDPDFCTARPYPGVCRYISSQDMTDVLIQEIMAGEVRTVAEAYPPPRQGPKLPGYAWLLEQDEWWYPHRRPAVPVALMDKPWRWNTVRFLERKAVSLHLAVGGRYMHDAPDEVWASYEHENPLQWLRSQPLMRVLGKNLPHPESAKGKALAARAIHWHTCRMRKTHPGRLDACTCITDGSGRTIGATNDPATTRRPVPVRDLDGRDEEWRLS